MEEHHYLRFHGIVGKGLRYLAVHGDTLLALIGWLKADEPREISN